MLAEPCSRPHLQLVRPHEALAQPTRRPHRRKQRGPQSGVRLARNADDNLRELQGSGWAQVWAGLQGATRALLLRRHADTRPGRAQCQLGQAILSCSSTPAERACGNCEMRRAAATSSGPARRWAAATAGCVPAPRGEATLPSAGPPPCCMLLSVTAYEELKRGLSAAALLAEVGCCSASSSRAVNSSHSRERLKCGPLECQLHRGIEGRHACWLYDAKAAEQRDTGHAQPYRMHVCKLGAGGCSCSSGQLARRGTPG